LDNKVKKYKMAIIKYIIGSILPILSLVLLAFLYKNVMCYYAKNSSSNASLICDLNWKDGAILLCCYCVVKLVSPLLDFDTIFKRVIITIVFYCFAYGLIAFPYLITSFLQPFLVNVFLHGLGLILITEYFFCWPSKSIPDR
jgi:hypothetical protein